MEALNCCFFWSTRGLDNEEPQPDSKSKAGQPKKMYPYAQAPTATAAASSGYYPIAQTQLYPQRPQSSAQQPEHPRVESTDPSRIGDQLDALYSKQSSKKQKSKSAPPLQPQLLHGAHTNPVHVPYAAPQPYTGGRVRALFIGINYAGKDCELDGCVNDVRTMLSTFERLAFPIAEAVVLVDDPAFPNCGGLPTKHNILFWMRWLVDGMKAGDVAVLHFSGHGSNQPNEDGTEEDGFDETMIPLDYETAGQIVDDEIFATLVRPMPPGTRLTAIVDCCHSGSMLDLPFEFTADRAEGVESSYYSTGSAAAFRRVSDKVGGGGDVVMFSGCSDSQTSADATGFKFATPSQTQHAGHAGGACTNALSEVLTGSSGLSFAQILVKMRANLAKRGFTQVPQLSCTRPIDLSKPFSMFGTLESASTFALPAWQAPPPLPPAQFVNDFSSFAPSMTGGGVVSNLAAQWVVPDYSGSSSAAIAMTSYPGCQQYQQQQQQQQTVAGYTSPYPTATASGGGVMYPIATMSQQQPMMGGAVAGGGYPVAGGMMMQPQFAYPSAGNFDVPSYSAYTG